MKMCLKLTVVSGCETQLERAVARAPQLTGRLCLPAARPSENPVTPAASSPSLTRTLFSIFRFLLITADCPLSPSPNTNDQGHTGGVQLVNCDKI